MKKRNFFILICLAVIIAASAVFVACDKTMEYKVTFGGEGVDGFSQTVTSGQTAVEPEVPTRTGYTFDGWYIGEEKYDFKTPVTADITLTAKWTGNKYTVTLGDTEQTKEVVFGEAYDLGIAETAELKDFVGWALNGTLLTNEAGVSLAVWDKTENVTVTAVWTEGSKTIEGLTYTEQEDGTLTVTATKPYQFGQTAEILTTVSGKTVTKIGAMQMLGCYEIKVPSTVKSISNSAFANNSYVEVVDLSEFSGTIGDMAFANCEVKIVELGKTSAIGSNAFANTKVKVLVIPASVKTIGDGALVSDNLLEIGFVGDVPSLGKNVFGDGKREDDEVDFRLTKTALDKIGTTVDEVNAALGTSVKADAFYIYSDEEMQNSVAMSGIFHTADKETLIYRGVGSNVLIYDYTDVQVSDLYDNTHAYKFLADSTERETFVFDYSKRTIEKIEKNANGETIKDGVLYDYQGGEAVYSVPNNVTAIAGGAGFGNQAVRFLIAGANVTDIGPYAFSVGNLFGVVIGDKIETVGEYAFFYQDYLQEIVFKGSTPPAIGEAAFCTIQLGGIMPLVILNGLTQYTGEAAVIYTPLGTSSYYGDPECLPYVEAFNKSLESIDNLPQIGDADDPDSMETVSYKTDMFSQLLTYGINKKDLVYTAPFGTVTMTGTDTGFAFVTFNEESGFSGTNYAFYSNMSGYENSSGYRKLQVYTGYNDAGENESFVVYGEFKDGVYNVRGEEAGSYGELGQDTLSLDGFGKYVFYGADSSTVEGTYSINGNNITLEGISGTVVFDAKAKTVTLNGKLLTALGEEAGVYYDVNNSAKITLDGKAYKSGDKVYSGTLTLVYKGKTAVTGYSINKTAFIFMLDGVEKSWTYSKTSADLLSGYYGNYTDNLKFRVIENTVIDTFNNGDSTLSLDGYFTATLNGKEAYYRMFGDSDSVLLIADGEAKIAYLNIAEKTYSYSTASEAGKWFVTTSANYAWYLDGAGNLLYFSGDEYVYGTYTLDANTKEFSVVYKGTAADNDEKGSLDVANGCGTIVYNTGWGNSYAGLSRVPFNPMGYGISLTVYSFIGAVNGDSIVTTSPSFSVYSAGNFVFVGVYGKPLTVISLGAPLAAGATFDYYFEAVKNEMKIPATYRFTAYEKDGAIAFTALPIEYYTQQSTLTFEDKEYTVSWFDNSHVMIWSMGSYGGETLVGGEITRIDENSFTVGEYKVTGYGTEEVRIEKLPAEEA